MTNINLLVLNAISEETGHEGVEMYNDGPKGHGSVQAGLFAEPGLKFSSKEGQKIVGQGPDTSSFSKESILNNLRDPSSINSLAGTNASVLKTGGNYEFSKKEALAAKLSTAAAANSLSGTNRKVIK